MHTFQQNTIILIVGLILIILELKFVLSAASINTDDLQIMEHGDRELVEEKAFSKEDTTFSPVIGVLTQVLRDYKSKFSNVNLCHSYRLSRMITCILMYRVHCQDSLRSPIFTLPPVT